MYNRLSSIFRLPTSKQTYRLFQPMADMLLPGCCVLCRTPAQSHQLCRDCWHGLALIAPPICQICGRPQAYKTPDGLCSICSLTTPIFAHIRAVCRYNATARDLLTGFKHAGKLDRTPLLGALCLALYESICADNSLVVAVPLHPLRYLRRGYNQSAELARWLFQHSRPHIRHAEFAPNLLLRQRHTPSMAGKDKTARRRNVRNAFAVNPNSDDDWKCRPILLIDDVMTTGATLQSCADTLTSAGHNNTISALVFARVL